MQAILGASLAAYSSLVHSLPLLLNRTQNWPIGQAHIRKAKHLMLCKAFGAGRSLQNQRVLVMKYLQLEHRYVLTYLLLLDLNLLSRMVVIFIHVKFIFLKYLHIYLYLRFNSWYQKILCLFCSKNVS